MVRRPSVPASQSRGHRSSVGHKQLSVVVVVVVVRNVVLVHATVVVACN